MIKGHQFSISFFILFASSFLSSETRVYPGGQAKFLTKFGDKFLAKFEDIFREYPWQIQITPSTAKKDPSIHFSSIIRKID